MPEYITVCALAIVHEMKNSCPVQLAIFMQGTTVLCDKELMLLEHKRPGQRESRLGEADRVVE